MFDFNGLPTELRLQIWQIISIQDLPSEAVNIYPQCGGCMKPNRGFRHAARQLRFSSRTGDNERSRRIQSTHIGARTKKAYLPITTRVNRESREETFKYWVIEYVPLAQRLLCFQPSYQQVYADWCCMSRSIRFQRWIRNLKIRHRGQIEKIERFAIDGVTLVRKSRLQEQVAYWNNDILGATYATGITEKQIANAPLGIILQLSNLRSLNVELFLVRNHFTVRDYDGKMLRSLEQFVKLHEDFFKNGAPVLEQVRLRR